MSEKLDAPREKIIKSLVKTGPALGFFANDGGDDTPVFPVDRLIGNLLEGGSASTGNAFGSVKEYIQNLGEAQQKEAAGLVADMTELAYLKGVKGIRLEEAKAFGADDVRQVEARLDAQIDDVTKSIRSGVASMPKVDVAEITKLVDASLRDASDPQNKIRGDTIKPMDSKNFKKAFNDIYEGLLQPAGSRASSEYSINGWRLNPKKLAESMRGPDYRIPKAPRTGSLEEQRSFDKMKTAIGDALRTSYAEVNTRTYNADELREAKATQRLAREGGLMEGPGAAEARAKRIEATEAANRRAPLADINSVFNIKPKRTK